MIEDIIKAWKKEDLLEQSLTIITEMFDTTHEMFSAVKCEYESSGECINKESVYNKDKKVNSMQIEVRRKILEHLSFSDAQDISASLIFLYVVNDLERIGDYCKNLEDAALMHKRYAVPKYFGYSDSIKEISEKIMAQFPKVKEAFLEDDAEKAKKINAEYQEIKKEVDAVIEGMAEDKKMDPGKAITNAIYARHLRRIAAHLKNIASSVVNPFERMGYKPKKESKTQ